MSNLGAALLCAAGLVGVCAPSRGAEVDHTNPCGQVYVVGQYGPYDYRVDKKFLPIVLGAHFTREVEALERGATGATPGGDIDYTLRAIPNNPRALIAMMRLGEREHLPQPRGARFTVECYFERALRFRPDDHLVRMLFSSFLIKNGRTNEAIPQLKYVESEADPEDPFTQNNLGLLYLDAGEFDAALRQARKAQALGLTPTELRSKLIQAGKWVDAEAPTGAASAPASSAQAASGPAGQ
ncbi:MAG: ABC transporter permease [Paucibacter sp.]|nr:ABC transporter permease [Roseateles sp.]